MVTPDELAADLGVTGRTVRAWLRTAYPRSAVERYQRWVLDAAMIAAARQHFADS